MIFNFKKFNLLQHPDVMPLTSDAVLLGSWARINDNTSLLDIGTGTGILSLMMAQRHYEYGFDFNIFAIDIDSYSVKLAQKNFDDSIWNAYLKTKLFSLQKLSLTSNLKYSHIICNPPFFNQAGHTSNDMKKRSRHQSELDSRNLLNGISKLLAINGICSIIIPYLDYDHLCSIIREEGMEINRLLKMRPRKSKPIERVVLEFSKENRYPIEENEITMYGQNGIAYTEMYSNLTNAFYME